MKRVLTTNIDAALLARLGVCLAGHSRVSLVGGNGMCYDEDLSFVALHPSGEVLLFFGRRICSAGVTNTIRR